MNGARVTGCNFERRFTIGCTEQVVAGLLERAPYGSELELRVLVPTPPEQVFGIKASLYRADGCSADTTNFRF